MPRWTCPACGREFGRANQSHSCAPAIPVEVYFANRPYFERQIFDAVRTHLDSLGEVVIEVVSVGVFFKRGRTFAELRPMKGRVRLSLLLTRPEPHPRFALHVKLSAARTAVFVDLQLATEVDDKVRDWLARAYLESPA